MREDWEGAIAAFTELIAKDKAWTRLYCLRAEARAGTHDMTGALVDLCEAKLLSKDGRHDEEDLKDIRRARGKLRDAGCAPGLKLLRSRDYADARDTLTQAIADDPENFQAYLLRAGAHEALRDAESFRKDMEQTRSILDRLIVEDPADADLYRERAFLREMVRDPKGALDDLGEAVRLAPTELNLSFRGRARIASDPDGAIADLERAMALNQEGIASIQEASGRSWPSMAFIYQHDLCRAHLARALNRFKKGDGRAALEDCDRAMALEPDSPTPFLVRARIRREAKNFLGAEQDAERAKALFESLRRQGRPLPEIPAD